jgi:isopenicillin-N epimerase
MPSNRREFLSTAAHAAGVGWLSAAGVSRVLAAARGLAGIAPEEAARDEDFWFTVREAYDLDSRHIILNAGASNPSPRAVQRALVRYLDYANGSPLVNNRDAFSPQRERVRRRIAGLVNCTPNEIALTRNTTEAVQTVLFGLALKPGDEVVTTDWDYYSMVNALRQREKRDGIVVKQIALKLPAPSSDGVVKAFRDALTPRTKAILLCHVIDGQGQILPVREVCDLAHEQGVQVVVDGALSFGHIACDLKALGCDYFGTSLHKWLSAPLGTGFLYVTRERIPSLWPLFGASDPQGQDIRKFEQIGTHSAPHFAAVNQALDFYEGVGVARKQARLHYLTRYWTDKVGKLPKVRINTPLDPDRSCGTVHLEIEGVDPRKLSQHFYRDLDIYVFPIVRNGLSGVYVSPNLFTRLTDLDQFADAVAKVAREGLPG